MRQFGDLPEEDPLYDAVGHQERTKQQIEQCVVLVRLELYNHNMPCGPKAVRKRLDSFYHVKPLHSERTIVRIL